MPHLLPYDTHANRFRQRLERVIGIDLGTTNSLVAYMDLTAPKVIPGEDADRLVPA